MSVKKNNIQQQFSHHLLAILPLAEMIQLSPVEWMTAFLLEGLNQIISVVWYNHTHTIWISAQNSPSLKPLTLQ